jgi:hypothetical protein
MTQTDERMMDTAALMASIFIAVIFISIPLRMATHSATLQGGLIVMVGGLVLLNALGTVGALTTAPRWLHAACALAWLFVMAPLGRSVGFEPVEVIGMGGFWGAVLWGVPLVGLWAYRRLRGHPVTATPAPAAQPSTVIPPSVVIEDAPVSRRYQHIAARNPAGVVRFGRRATR